MLNAIVELLNKDGIKYELDIALFARSSFKVGGRGAIGIFPKSVYEMISVFSALQIVGMEYRIIGKGSNLLFADGFINKAFVFTEDIKNIKSFGKTIYADSGVSLASLAIYARDRALSGLEFAKGIPGSVGGAVYMNAGAYGGQISDCLVSSKALDIRSGKIFDITEHGFSYRDSIYMRNEDFVCLGATFSLDEGSVESIDLAMKDFAYRRRATQPLELPSAGSYFKRPEGNFAGKLIEDANLKGYRIGGAAVSDKHAGFIVNLGDATASDVLALEEYVKNTVQRLYGVVLEREVRYID